MLLSVISPRTKLRTVGYGFSIFTNAEDTGTAVAKPLHVKATTLIDREQSVFPVS